MARHNVRDAQGRFTKAKPIAGVRVLKARQTPARLHAGRYVHDEAYDEEQHDMGPWIQFPRSTRVMAIRYDYQNNAVQVTWKRGGAPYIYLDVPYERFRSFIRANSQGKYINSAMNDYDKRPATPEELDAPTNEQRSAQSRVNA